MVAVEGGSDEAGQDLSFKAAEIGTAVAAGQVSAVAVVRAALERLAAVDGWLRAFTEVFPVEAEAQAAEIDARVAAGDPVGVLAGVPIAVKGRGGLSDVQTGRLRAAGAIPIGVTSTPRGGGPQTWGYTDRGPTRNPWCGDLSPGGSSAGSAAAVAAGVVPLATGSDGAGSSRIPAAWCGVFGYKPTTGLLPSRDPTGLAVPAPLARHPDDLRFWADVVLFGGRSTALEITGPARTAAWSSDLGYAMPHLDEEVVTVARQAAERLVAETRPGMARAAGRAVRPC